MGRSPDATGRPQDDNGNSLMQKITSEWLSIIGRKGGMARAKSMSPKQRKTLAKRAINMRWKNHKKKPKNGKNKSQEQQFPKFRRQTEWQKHDARELRAKQRIAYLVLQELGIKF
jgi:hypothetical protein